MSRAHRPAGIAVTPLVASLAFVLGLAGCHRGGATTARAAGPAVNVAGGAVGAPSTGGTGTAAPAVTTTSAPPATTVPPPTAPPSTRQAVAGAAAAPTAAPATSAPPTPAAAVAAPTAGRPLAGRVVAIDPGHNGGNGANPSFINHLVWNGRSEESCDTTGTETNGGYTEALFNFQVAGYLAADLRAQGATVVLSRPDNSGVGPCITQRAAFANLAHASAAISIHADGGPAGGRGFAVLEPVSDGVNAAIIGPSASLGADIRDAFRTGAGMPTSTYDGVNGIQPRDDLGGLNLSTVPKVLIETGNMRNATDAALLTSPTWQQGAAQALAQGIVRFLG